jgi:uncharacterized protein
MSPAGATVHDIGADRPAPVDSGERLHTLDILRGLAVFGMILVHFHQRVRAEVTGLEDLIAWGVWVLLEDKSHATFAFLFGVGFAVLLRRLEARGVPVVAIYLRRLAVLAVFGIVVQVGFGISILFTYATYGVVLLVIRHWSTRALLVVALISACALPVASIALAVASHLTGTSLTLSSGANLYVAASEAAQQADYLTLLGVRWAWFTSTLPHDLRTILPTADLTLFVLGLLALRHGIIDRPREHTRLIVRWMIAGAVLWAASWLLLPRMPELPVIGARLRGGLGLVRDSWLCFTYIGAVFLWFAYRPHWIPKLALVGAAGRMALTNYVVQAVVLDVISSGYGFGLRLRPIFYVLAAVALFGALAMGSRAWLQRYRFGPLEWIWRTLTYARRQPLRRESVPDVQLASA